MPTSKPDASVANSAVPQGYSLRCGWGVEGFDLDRVHHWLSEDAYWARGRPRSTVEAAARHSLNVGVFAGGEQVAYARVVTDEATFAWLCDVYVDPAHRGRGLGDTMVGEVVAHLREQGLGRVMLATADAHALYARHGFEPLADPARWMTLALQRQA